MHLSDPVPDLLHSIIRRHRFPKLYASILSQKRTSLEWNSHSTGVKGELEMARFVSDPLGVVLSSVFFIAGTLVKPAVDHDGRQPRAIRGQHGDVFQRIAIH